MLSTYELIYFMLIDCRFRQPRREDVLNRQTETKFPNGNGVYSRDRTRWISTSPRTVVVVLEVLNRT